MKNKFLIYISILIGLGAILYVFLPNKNSSLICIILPSEGINQEFEIMAACDEGVKFKKAGQVSYIEITSEKTNIEDIFDPSIAVGFFVFNDSSHMVQTLDQLDNVTDQIEIIHKNYVRDSCKSALRFRIIAHQN